MFGSLYSVSLPEGLEREGERGKYLGVDYDILRQSRVDAKRIQLDENCAQV